MGLTMAERLATELKAKLVLVGRTPMPEREEWDDWLRSRGGDDSVGRKIRKVQELERAGAEVLVLAGDVTNPDQMRDIFQAAGARFGVVHGVLHTAGVVKDELIQLKLESNIADVFGPKIHGTVVLDSLLEEAGIELGNKHMRWHSIVMRFVLVRNDYIIRESYTTSGNIITLRNSV